MTKQPARIAEELEIQTPYLRLAARAWGSPEDTPVLALHGWLDNAASFDTLAPLLPGTRLVAIDLTGHGYSDHRPPGIHYHLMDFVDDSVAVADALGWDHFALLGHSMGSSLASFIAASLPERVTRLAVIEGLGPPISNPADGPANLRKSIEQMRTLPHKRPPVYATIEEAVHARSQGSGLSQQAATILTKRGLCKVKGGFTWRADPRLRIISPLYVSEPQVLAYLEHIQTPTLLICGDAGYLVHRAYMQERYARVTNLSIEFVAGGHHPHLEDPEPCARLLKPFFVTARRQASSAG
ncbi:MAG: alpha/beta hydrolase [Candidatus Contendobacter odensis]|uniref:Alpha/beta hydrolase n=1 Tax=Candidatus Contendibacter odensensis TaxID=1400860 RepID=A0A2G6PER1_9GAMM|nr:MAG: alpha/beta hydrolase [Candidatus Contendobacter odensis]